MTRKYAKNALFYLDANIDRTYNFLENVDLVEEHALLVVVHVGLTEDLDSTLSSRLSMDAHTNLTERT